MNHQHFELFNRHKLNPILTAADWPYPIHSVFNPGAALLPDGTTLLLCRVEDRRGQSHLCAARSVNGVDDWQIDPHPTLAPDPDHFPEELWGIEDPRITYLPELSRYAIVYTAYSRAGPGLALAFTEDFRHFERYGMIMSPEDKNAALLPHRIGNFWALIHRPVSYLGGHMWISYSPDLRHWGSHKLMLEARLGGWWDANKIGLEAIHLAWLYKQAAHWLSAQLRELDRSDPGEKLLAEKVFVERLRELRLRATEVRSLAHTGTMEKARVEREYHSLACLFRVRFSTFQRKRYVNLSHEPNKAMIT